MEVEKEWRWRKGRNPGRRWRNDRKGRVVMGIGSNGADMTKDDNCVKVWNLQLVLEDLLDQ